MCNSSISDGSHGNTLGTYAPPARLDNVLINRNTIINQGTTMDGPGQSWSPLAKPNSSLGFYGSARSTGSPTDFEFVGAVFGDPELYTGMGVAVMAGAGVEQIRRVISARPPNLISLNRPFEVPLDGSSVVALTLYRHRVSVVGNSFSTSLNDIMFWVYGGCTECSISFNQGRGNQPANSTNFGFGLWRVPRTPSSLPIFH